MTKIIIDPNDEDQADEIFKKLATRPKEPGTGCYNTAFGYQALRANTTGNSNTAFGYHSYNMDPDIKKA